MTGSILIDNDGTKWQILSYQGDKLRAFNMQGFLLSEAEGKNLQELIFELEAIEEITIIDIEKKGE